MFDRRRGEAKGVTTSWRLNATIFFEGMYRQYTKLYRNTSMYMCDLDDFGDAYEGHTACTEVCTTCYVTANSSSSRILSAESSS